MTREQAVLKAAASELSTLLSSVFRGSFGFSGYQPTGYLFDLAVDRSLKPFSGSISASDTRCRIAGESAAEVLCGVYTYLERLGFHFTVRGPVAPDLPIDKLPVFESELKPFLNCRGIRQHINFPMDISGYPLSEAREYLRNLARMRFNTITFHLYEACGWYHLDLKALKKHAEADGRAPVATFFYSEPHDLPADPEVARKVRNCARFCPPEVEPVYGTEQGKPVGYAFLRSLIDEARRFGFYVILSVEPFTPQSNSRLADGVAPGHALHVDLTLEVLHQVMHLYPEIDEIEIMSGENHEAASAQAHVDIESVLRRLLPWNSDDLIRRKMALLAASIQENKPQATEPPETVERKFLACLQAVSTALAAFEKAKTHPALRPFYLGKPMAIAIYCTAPAIMKPLAHVLSEAVPADYRLAWIPAHGADVVQRNLGKMALPPKDRGRFRLYSWAEIDGYMYTLQFPGEPLRENVRYGADEQDIPQGQGVLFHHWRNAENELALLFSSYAAWSGGDLASFAEKTLAPLWGIDRSEPVLELLQALVKVNDLSISTSAANGFCYYPCWVAVDGEKDMRWVQWCGGQGEYRPAVEAAETALAKVRALIAIAGRPVGIARLKFLEAMLLASIEHFGCARKLFEMRQYLLSIDRTRLTAEQRQEFQKLGDSALGHANRWMAITAAHVADRGMEGNLCSYEHVIIGYIRYCLGLHGTGAPVPAARYEVPKIMQAPPLSG